MIPKHVRCQTPEKKIHSAFIHTGMMPCYSSDYGGPVSCKLVSLFPGNSALGKPTHIVYVLLFDAVTGEPIAIMVHLLRTNTQKTLCAKFFFAENGGSFFLKLLFVRARVNLGMGELQQILINRFYCPPPSRSGRRRDHQTAYGGGLGPLGKVALVQEEAVCPLRPRVGVPGTVSRAGPDKDLPVHCEDKPVEPQAGGGRRDDGRLKIF